MSAIDDYQSLVLDCDWYPPRPGSLGQFRELLVNKLTTPLSVAAVASLAKYLTRDPITDPDIAVRHGEALLRQLQGDLRHATLYHADQQVSALVGHQTSRKNPLLLTSELVPARNGLITYAWPCASTTRTEPRLDLVAMSWTPSRNPSWSDGGLDLTFWAAPTRYVRRHLHTVAADAGFGDNILTRRGWQKHMGPLVLVNQWSWKYGTPQKPDNNLRGYLQAAQATFVAVTKPDHVRTELVRQRRRGFLQPRQPYTDTEAYQIRLAAAARQSSPRP